GGPVPRHRAGGAALSRTRPGAGPPGGRGAPIGRRTCVPSRLTVVRKGFKIDPSWCAPFCPGGSPMRRLPLIVLLPGLAAVLALLLAAPGGRAQETKAERAKFETADGVEIEGLWYAGTRRNAPCVLLLHALGEDSRKQYWQDLAKTLNKKGYAV